MSDVRATIRGLARRLSLKRHAPVPKPGAIRPELTSLLDDGATAHVGIDGIADAVPAQLIIRGRKSGLEVGVELDGSLWGTARRAAVLVDGDFAPFADETVDLFVQVHEIGQTQRLRLSAGDVDLALKRGNRRWYSTTEGNLSMRRPTAVEVIAESGVFDVEHYRKQARELPVGVDPIEHYVSVGAASGLNPSTVFDTTYYRKNNPAARGQNPLAHYCEGGWRELRNPSERFDTWWYWYKHLDPTDTSVNPLAHYESIGKRRRLSTRPDPYPSRRLGIGHRHPAGQPVRRICLFAGYDPDGLVDPYVIDYVRELSAHADVYYLADCAMSELELAKLAPHCRGFWAERHGHYDFGSYARLIAKIGWAEIEEYDELLLVNDSCYLLRPLDDVFQRMSSAACDWWGLQATKGLRQTRKQPTNQFREPIELDSVRSSLIDAFEDEYTYDFLVGSYFLAFRRPVIRDPEFRRYLLSVTEQERKRDIVKKYEVGLTRWLIHHGHAFDTYVPRLYPFHPIFTMWYFRLLDEGFPLLKRYFLAENHYRVPRLSEWPALVRSKVPNAAIEVFQSNLVRVTDPEKLDRSLTIGAAPPDVDGPVPAQPLSRAEFVASDAVAPKHANWWVFPVDESGNLTGNERALFEEVKDDPSIRKIVLTREVEIALSGTDVEIVTAHSALAQHRLVRSGAIFIGRRPALDLLGPVSGELHNLIGLSADVAFSRVGYAAEQPDEALDRVAQEQSRLRAVISSSKLDRLARMAASYPLTIHQIWVTGLPRHDLILCPEHNLPFDLRAELDRLRALLDGRRLILFAPVRRNGSDAGAYPFTAEELERLTNWLDDNNAILGVRQIPSGQNQPYLTHLAPLPALDLSAASFVHVEALYRTASAMITDYASCFVDFSLTGRPMISFAHDLEVFNFTDGTFYDLELVFPGPVCRTYAELEEALSDLLDRDVDPAYESRRRLLVDHLDAGSSARVIGRVRELIAVHGIGTWSGERVA